LLSGFLTFTTIAVLSTAAAAADPAHVLGDVAEQMGGEARAVSTLLDTTLSGKSVTRQFSRADGVYFFVLMPAFKDQVTVSSVLDVDALADRAFRRLDVSLPRLGKIDHFQGFRTHQYRDGASGITYAMLIPRDRSAELSASNESKTVKSLSFCDIESAPIPPHSFPVNENDNYAKETAGADSAGVWYNSRWAFEALACPTQGCNPNSPTGYIWTVDKTCAAQDPQPASPPNPPTPSPATTSSSGAGGILWGIIPSIIPGNIGMGWVFACSYGGTPISCWSS